MQKNLDPLRRHNGFIRGWLICLFVVGLMAVETGAFPLKLQEGAILRDSEVEETLMCFLKPALDPIPELHTVRLYLVATDTLNAFATPQREIFFNTGLITKMDSVEELISVLYHELGHIVGKHSLKQVELLRSTQTRSLLSTVLGLLAAGLLKNAAGMGVGQIGEYWAYADLMSFSRTHESSADQFALNTLNQLKWPVKGFIEIMRKLDQYHSSKNDVLYLRTHPFSEDRVRAAQHYINQFSSKNPREFPPHFHRKFQTIKVKILAYSTPLPLALQTIEHMSIPETLKAYGRAIVYYRLGQAKEALQALELSEKDPALEKAYLEEVRAQILLEARRVPEALQALNKALLIRPHDGLLSAFKAQILTTLEDPQSLEEAVRLLEKLLLSNEADGSIWYNLGIAYGKQKKIGPMRVCFAEEAIHRKDRKKAEFYVQEALKHLRPGQPYYQKAKDLENLLKNLEKEGKSSHGSNLSAKECIGL